MELSAIILVHLVNVGKNQKRVLGELICSMRHSEPIQSVVDQNVSAWHPKAIMPNSWVAFLEQESN